MLVSMTEPYEVDWASKAERLAEAARDEVDWYAALAGELVQGPGVTAVDVGCGGGGMTAALATVLDPSSLVVAVDATPDLLKAAEANLSAIAAAARARVTFVQADLVEGVAGLRKALDRPADLVWASASVHHLGDQQAAVGALASLLAPGGRLALAEGGLRPRHLPWDLGIGAPGLEMRLDVAQDRWFARMRTELPGSTPMPYGWTEALRRAGLLRVTTRSTLIERAAPLDDGDRGRVLDVLAHRVDRLHPTGLLDLDDLAIWGNLLDPQGPDWLGHRNDLYWIEARSVHIGVAGAA
jgi:SAM-dependent methyltransferase